MAVYRVSSKSSSSWPLFDMSRIQAGVLEPWRTATSLAELVTTVVGDVTRR
ncbi:MAG TPA: hypothetical protein VLW50_08690 [Streptosporangiaceae bacterium]|nr:hypothetical protein [Streptosporangiaceae bacterium]